MRYYYLAPLAIIIILIFKADFVSAKTITPDNVGVFGIPNDAAAQALGAKWTRYTLNWGKWDAWKAGRGEKPEQIAAIENSPNLNIILTFAPIHPTKTHCVKLVGKEGKTVCPPNNLTEYKNWVKQVVTEYKDDVEIWQLGNEVYSPEVIKFWNGPFDDPNQIDFMDTFAASLEGVKSADPDAKIITPGIAFEKINFDANGTPRPDAEQTQEWEGMLANFKKLINKHCNDIDYYDIHLYWTVESIPGRTVWTKSNTANCPRPIYATEMGPNVGYDYQSAQEVATVQQQEIQPRYQAAIDNGVEMADWFYYQDITGGEGAKDTMAWFGLVNSSGTPKAAYNTLQQITGVPSGGSGGSGSGNTGDSGGGNGSGSSGGNTGSASGSRALWTFVPGNNPASGFPTTASGIVALVFNIVIAASGAIFLIIMLIGGVSYLTAAGNEEGLTNAKKMMINAIVGLLITLSSYAIGIWVLQAVGLL